MVEAEVFDGVALGVSGCALEEVYCYNVADVVEEDSFVGDVNGAAEVEEVCAVAEGVVDGNCPQEHVQEDTGISLVAEVSPNFVLNKMSTPNK